MVGPHWKSLAKPGEAVACGEAHVVCSCKSRTRLCDRAAQLVCEFDVTNGVTKSEIDVMKTDD